MQTERIGVYAVASIIEKIGFVFREQAVEDYGIDAIIEERSIDNKLTGKLIGVQIKSGTSFFSEIKNGKVIFRGEMKHYDYWTHYSLPVILVLYNPETQLCIYEVISTDKITKTEKGWKIEIDINNRLENASNILCNLNISQSEYQKRLSTLAFAKGLMKLAEEGTLIVEVREWINKTSGKGDFIIKTLDHTGTMKELFGKTVFGFGYRPYEEVLPEVFPWADLELDSDYYEMYGDQEYMLRKKHESPDIYPYRNTAGEVDWYQFKPVLNDVGKAFLLMDEFLSIGRMYNIRF